MPLYWITLRCADQDQLLRHLFTLRNLYIIETIKRQIKLIAAVLQLYTLSSVLTLTCIKDLTVAKVLKFEVIRFNAVKDLYFTSKKFEKLGT
jgi:hypothetical protein